MLNKLRCHAHFQFSANQITCSGFLIEIRIFNDKKCRSRSVGFFRSQLIWIYTVCKCRVYTGSAGQGLSKLPIHLLMSQYFYLNLTFSTPQKKKKRVKRVYFCTEIFELNHTVVRGLSTYVSSAHPDQPAHLNGDLIVLH